MSEAAEKGFTPHFYRADQLELLQPGDAIVSIDRHELNPFLVVEAPLGPTASPDVVGVKLVHDSPVEWLLYPGQVSEAVFVHRPITWNTDHGIRLVPSADGSFTSESGRYRIFAPTRSILGYRVWDATAREFLEGWGQNEFSLEEAVELIIQQDVEDRI